MGKRSPKVPNTDQIFEYACKRFINVDKGKKKCVNPLVKKVLKTVTNTMKTISPLFKNMFETFIYAGSSYDGLKIGKPDEYDIDLKLNLLKIPYCSFTVFQSNRSGFVHIQLINLNKSSKRTQNKNYMYKELMHFIDDKNYISHKIVKQWMESLISKAITIISNTRSFEKLDIKYEVHGPAVTLVICDEISIDLVPVFKIPGIKWPAPPVRQINDSMKNEYMIVPKPPKKIDDVHSDRYWRLSFPQQEQMIMRDKHYCKPALRLLKKLRDTRTQNMPSYYIKTIFLWEIKKRNPNFWKNSLTVIFLDMLKVYINYLSANIIPYYWDPDNNLIECNSEINIENIKNYLQGILTNIELNIHSNPFIIVKHILLDDEYKEVCKYFNYPVM